VRSCDANTSVMFDGEVEYVVKDVEWEGMNGRVFTVGVGYETRFLLGKSCSVLSCTRILALGIRF